MSFTAPASPSSPATQRQRWQGRLEGEIEGLVYGWAIDLSQPYSRVVVELCLDGEAVVSMLADISRNDLAFPFHPAPGSAANTDQCHGFVADIRGLLPERVLSPIVATARVANTDVMLSGELLIGPDNGQDSGQDGGSPSAPAGPASRVYGGGGLRLHGWVIDPLGTGRPQTVRAFIGSKQVAETVSNDWSGGAEAQAGRPRGFELNLPLALADGSLHSVRVVNQQGVALNGSPLAICCYAAGASTLLEPGNNPLLEQLIKGYESLLPASVSMAAYPEWAARFGPGDSSAARAALPALRVGIIVSDFLAPGAVAERTMLSLTAQSLAPAKIFSGAPFAQLLESALAAPVDIIASVRNGDTLAPQALELALEGYAHPGVELVYTDSENQGKPWFKPAWNPDYALASDYPLELMLARASSLRALFAGGSELPSNAAAFSWSALAATWPRASEAIVHIPHVLYHLHAPLAVDEQQARYQAAAAALSMTAPGAKLTPMARLAAGAQASDSAGARRVQHPVPAPLPSVTLIIPTRDKINLLRRCIESIERYTPWPRLEIMVIDNGSTQAVTKDYLAALKARGVTVLERPGPFNFATLNNDAVGCASGEVVGLVNNDIEALHDGWLDEMVSQLMRPGVGAVGAKLLWPNGMVQHGGVLLGMGYVAGHFGNRLNDTDWGDHGRNQLVQQVSAVTAACLLMRRDDYLALGGMDGDAFPVAFNDVDLCLKVRRSGKAIIWTPHARLLHAESASRGREDTIYKQHRAAREIGLLRERWGAALLHDPAYHPSLTLDTQSQAFGGLALPPRQRTPRLGGLFSRVRER